MRITFIFIATLFITGCASDFIGSAVRMTPEEERVHTISDTTGCEFITTTINEEAAQHVHTYIKKRVVASGGNAYKVLSTEEGRTYFGDPTGRVSYEIWNCDR